MLLASVTEVVERLGFDAMTDITFAVTMAMDAAEPQLAGLLNTDFDRGTFTDTFYVDEPTVIEGQAFATEFRLTRGLIASITSVKVAYEYANFTDGSVLLDYTPTVILHSGKGLVKDVANRYSRQYVQIVYVAGFDPDASSPPIVGSYSLAEVPDWLQQACKIKTLLGLVDDASLSEAQIKLEPKVLQPQLNSLLSKHLRYAPLALLPL
jgi:hypothetical protein